MTGLYVSLSVLAALIVVIFAIAMAKTWTWNNSGTQIVRGLGLPEGSISGLIAILVVGAFVLFVFFGKPAVTATNEQTAPDANGNPVTTKTEDTTLFTTVITAFGTLTGAVAGFYFGGRTAQAGNEEVRNLNSQLIQALGSSIPNRGGGGSP